MNGSINAVAIVGKGKMGKTTLAKHLLQRHLDAGSLCFVFDFIGGYDGQVFTDRRKLNLTSNGPFLYRGSDDRYFADTVWQAGRTGRQVLCVLDEVDIFGKTSFPLAYLYRYGRHRNVALIAIARRVYDLPVYIRDLSREIKIFRLSGERDFDFIRKQKNIETAQLVRSLPPHHFITLEL